MAQKKISDMSLEELKAQENKLKKLNPLLAVIIVLMVAAGTFLTFRNGFSVFTVLPIVFLPIFIANTTTLKNIRKEIAQRK